MTKEYIIIANPISGSGKGKADWPIIEKILNAYDLKFQVHFTNSKGNAIELAKEYYQKGFRHFIAAGGDGTLNEVVNGVIEFNDPEVTIGLIPVGTGNDWVRHHGIKNDYAAAIEVIKNGKLVSHDLAKTTFFDGNKTITYYFLNMLGGGFDGEVSLKVERDKQMHKSNMLSYYIHILGLMFTTKPFDAEYVIDGKVFREKVFSFAVGVCKYSGKGIKQCPAADTYDGLLDITIIKDLNRFAIIKCLLGMFSGAFVNHPRVDTYQCKEFSIQGYDVPVEADGQTMYALPMKIESVPAAIKLYMI